MMNIPVTVEVTSFGFLHGEPPAAHLVVDLREHFRDPHISPDLRQLTAHDQVVRDTVMATPGIAQLVDALVDAVTAFRRGPSTGLVRVAVGCAGGRHRAAVVARILFERLGEHQVVELLHRDLGKPVVDR